MREREGEGGSERSREWESVGERGRVRRIRFSDIFEVIRSYQIYHILWATHISVSSIFVWPPIPPLNNNTLFQKIRERMTIGRNITSHPTRERYIFNNIKIKIKIKN